jgi:cytochrome c biogenesis protein ResB
MSAETQEKKRGNEKGGMDAFLEKGWVLFKSMRFAIIILLILAVASIFNLFANEFIIPTSTNADQARMAYAQQYGPLKANLLTFFQMYNPYYSWWYTGLLAVLLLSLIICLIDRTPNLLRKSFSPKYSTDTEALNMLKCCYTGNGDGLEAKTTGLFKKYGYGIRTKKEENKTYIDASKNQWAHFGNWLIHVGFVLLIIGGAMIARGSYNVNTSGLPGEFLVDSEDYWGFNVRVDDFEIHYHPLAVRQYVEIDGNIIGRLVSENEDGTFDAETFTPQRGFLTDISPDRIKNRIDRRFNGSRIDQVNISDYVATLTIFEKGREIRTEVIEVNKPMRHRGYRFYQSSFSDTETDAQGRWTTVINVRKDSGAPFVWAGIMVVSLGLIIGMYFQPKRINAVITKEESGESIVLGGTSLRNKSLFQEHFEQVVNELKAVIK